MPRRRGRRKLTILGPVAAADREPGIRDELAAEHPRAKTLSSGVRD